MTALRSPERARPAVGAPLLPPVLAYLTLTVLGVALPPLIAGEAGWGSSLLDFYQHHVAAAHASAFFTLGAAVPFAILTAVATTRLRTLGLDVPGRMIALIGGTVAAALLAVSGLATLALTQPHASDSTAVVHAIYGLSFAAGGPGFVVFSGLLLAGISVTGLLGGVLPRWLAWFGLVIAAISELASLSVAFTALDPLLPIGRFGAMVWLLGIGLLLPSSRAQLRARRGVTRAADQG